MWLTEQSKAKGATKYDLSKRGLTTINFRTFESSPEVEILDLSNNWLGYYAKKPFSWANLFDCFAPLQISVFHTLSNLRELYLQRNIFEYLTPGVFNGLINLRILRLGHNLFTTLEENLFYGLERLEELNLQYNRLKDLSGEIFDGLPHLKGLYLEPQSVNGLSKEQIREFKMKADQNKDTCGIFKIIS